MQGIVWLLVLAITGIPIQITAAQPEETETAQQESENAVEAETEAVVDEVAAETPEESEQVSEEIEEQVTTAPVEQPETESQPAVTQPESLAAPAAEPIPSPQPSMQPQPVAQPTAAPALPSAAPQTQPMPAAQPPKTVEAEFDTTDITEPSGNWLYKRYWWSLAEQRYDKIQDAMNKIVEAQTPFFTKREEVEEKIFDPLIFSMGLSLGELAVILSDLNEQVRALKEKQGAELTPEQKDFLDTITIQQKTLEQLQEDVQGISKIDNVLDEDLQKLSEQIKRARDFEKDAWENFRAIAKELSDAKARELYYAIEAFEKSISDIQLYIEKPLTHHFDQLIKIAKDQSERITHAIQGLKEKGIDFKQRAETMEKEAAGKPEIEKKEEEAAVQEESTWTGKIGYVWNSIMGSLASVWGGIADSVSGAYSWITSFFVSEPAEKPAEPAAQSDAVKKEGELAILQQPEAKMENVTVQQPKTMPAEPLVSQPAMPSEQQEAVVEKVEAVVVQEPIREQIPVVPGNNEEQKKEAQAEQAEKVESVVKEQNENVVE